MKLMSNKKENGREIFVWVFKKVRAELIISPMWKNTSASSGWFTDDNRPEDHYDCSCCVQILSNHRISDEDVEQLIFELLPVSQENSDYWE